MDCLKFASKKKYEPVEMRTETPMTQDSLNIYVSWQNLSFKVPDPKDKTKDKIILNDLNGCAKPGELVGIIGPSGSGKSSFLNIISGRIIDGVKGEVLINNVPRQSIFSRFTGYVIQDDLYFQTLSVRETLSFASHLKLPKHLKESERKQRVNDIIDELDLHKCADTIIGQIGDGISGGERRRLAIGMEIINKPSLLMLDEPTTGLDSASALMVGNILKKLSKTYNITILCSVHQPRYELTAMFDKLYFLGDGNEIYFGPSVPECLAFFAKAGYKCPEYHNPADFLLDLVNTTNQNKEGQSPEHVHEIVVVINEEKSVETDKRNEIVSKLAASYQASEYRKVALEHTVPDEWDGNIAFQMLTKNQFYITDMDNQIFVITKRCFIRKWREPVGTVTQLFGTVLMAIILGTIYWQIDLTIQSSFDRISAIAMVMMNVAFITYDSLTLFPTERAVFNREQSAGMYRPISFFLGLTSAEIPMHIIFAVVSGTIAYWMFGLQEDVDKYFIFMVISVLTVMCGSGFTFLCSALAKNIVQAQAIYMFPMLVLMLFDGNWISLDKVPVYWHWMGALSFVGYASNAAIANEYRGLVFVCTSEERENGNCTDDLTGEQMLYNRGLHNVDVSFNIFMLLVLCAGFRIAAFFFFWLLHRNQKPTQIIKDTLGCVNKKEQIIHQELNPAH